MIRCDSLLQNATDVISKYDSYFITKCDRSLLQNASGFFLQNATVLLQNATGIAKCDDFITNCGNTILRNYPANLIFSPAFKEKQIRFCSLG